MIKTAALIFVAAMLASAQDRPAAAASPRTTADLRSLPADATPAGPNLYRYTDTDGKIWLYSRTPFGISRRLEQPAAKPVVSDAPSVAVADLGDSVRFKVQTPFGISQWVSKKADLTDGEQLMLLRQQLKTQQSKEQWAADKSSPLTVEETK